MVSITRLVQRFAAHRGAQTDPFELQRREQETRNERVINWLRSLLFGLGTLGHTINHVFHVAPFPSPIWIVLILGSGLLGCAWLHVYLRRNPPYHWWRKYLIATVELLIPTLGLSTMVGAVPPMLAATMPLLILMFFIVLNGLRLTLGTVFLSCGLTIPIHLVLFASHAPPELRTPISAAAVAAPLMIALVTSMIVISMIRLHREAAFKEHLTRFLAPELVSEIGRNPRLMTQQTELRTATVLFTDIRGFTSLSERLSPDEVVTFLNLFLGEMTAAVMEHGGMLDKYIGDSVMAVFGVPVAHPDHARRAILAGIDMCKRLERLNTALQSESLPALSIGVGIHTGELVVGAIGSPQRLEYTVIGDSVNVAARLESLTRNYPLSILVSDAVRESDGGTSPLSRIDTVRVKGRAQEVTVWSPDVAAPAATNPPAPPAP
ncbi:MAG: adenylate/guanylate cyclase domain-containing protein [Planctomycetota bacterium]